jgi:DNA polymerase (family 10)
MRTRRGGWSFTLLFSNTVLAHKSGKTHDWVVIYYERGGEQHQCTVVTAARGKLQEHRVVRGRERECREHYGL